jgi:3-phenylpropionate/trans-cinnamate dioxygenase ferredoxin reductase subunit
MSRYKYLIVGGGMTADSAVQGIRKVDNQAAIGLISAESDRPYNRPPLSKALWKGKPLDAIWRKTEQYGVEMHLGRQVMSLDRGQRQVVDDASHVYTYERLLLATGTVPRRLPFGQDQIIYFRTLADYRRLRSLADQGRRFAVIGGGFIGLEIAAALAMNGKEVLLIARGPSLGSRMLPRELSTFLTRYYQDKGVEVLTDDMVIGAEAQAGRTRLTLSRDRTLTVDGVVAGLGVQPETTLAREAGLNVDDGIRVDEFLRTDDADVYAAGDVAQFRSAALGRRVRVEHEDNANTMGAWAGRAMAGQAEPYRHLPYFYSDLFDLGYEAVGDLDSKWTTVSDWEEPNHKGVVYYLDQGRVRGVLLWNVWNQVDAARELIKAPGPFEPSDLKGRLTPAHV